MSTTTLLEHPVVRSHDERRCIVCEQPSVDRPGLTECCECGGWFHLDITPGGEERSCGAVTVGQGCGWNAACEPCMQRIEAARTRA